MQTMLQTKLAICNMNHSLPQLNSHITFLVSSGHRNSACSLAAMLSHQLITFSESNADWD